MKQTKRILGMLLSLCLVLGMLPGVALAANNSQFTDVDAWDWYYEAVQYVSREGLMSGTSATTFEPDSTTSRGMIVTILYRLEGSPAYLSAGYTDVPANEWYAPAVAWATTYNIVKGYGEGKFGPNDPITREQLAMILFRYSQLKKYNTSMTGDLTQYSDSNKISSYDAQIALSWALGKGVMTGADSGLLEPQTEVTRALAAYTLKNYKENVVALGNPLAPTGWTSNSTPQPATVEEETTYTVTFYLNYGKNELYQTKTVKAGETIVKPETPRRENYSFLGWYTTRNGNGRVFDFNSAINSDVTLYAQWGYDGGHYRNTYWLQYRVAGTTNPWQYWNGSTVWPGWVGYEWEVWDGYQWRKWDNYDWQYFDSVTGLWTDWTAAAAPQPIWNGSSWSNYRWQDKATAKDPAKWQSWNLYWDNYYWWQYEDDYDDWYWWYYYQNGYNWPYWWY